jgi:hypothetical protein
MSLIKRDTNYDAARGIDTVGAIARQSAANTKQKEEKEKQMSGYTKIGAPPAAASVVSPELLSRIPGTMAYRAAHAKQGGMGKIALPSYDEGTDSVPEDQVALIHEGEKIVPANENPDNKQPLIAAAPADKSVQAPHPATEPESMQSTQQLIQDSPEEKAIDVDKKSAMGQGSNGFVKLGTALIHEKALGLGDDEFRPTMSEDAVPGYSRIGGTESQAPATTGQGVKRMGVQPAEPITSDVNKSNGLAVGMPRITDMHQEKAQGALIPEGETSGNQRDFRNAERKGKVAQLEAQRQDALASGDLTTADKLAVAKAQLENTPWKDRSGWSKFGKIASTIGNVAGDVVAPGIMAITPGTDLNKAARTQGAYNRIAPDVEADYKQAETEKAQTALKNGPQPKLLAGEENIATAPDGTRYQRYELANGTTQWVKEGEAPRGATAQPTAQPTSTGAGVPQISAPAPTAGGLPAGATIGKPAGAPKEETPDQQLIDATRNLQQARASGDQTKIKAAQDELNDVYAAFPDKAAPTSDAVRTFVKDTLPSYTNIPKAQQASLALEATQATTKADLDKIIARADGAEKAEQVHKDSMAAAASGRLTTFQNNGITANEKLLNDPHSGYLGTAAQLDQTRKSIIAGADGNALLTNMVPTMEVLGINHAAGISRISPAEATAAGLSPEWATRWNAWAQRAGTGSLSPELAKEGSALVDIIQDTQYRKLLQQQLISANGHHLSYGDVPSVDKNGEITTLDKAVNPNGKSKSNGVPTKGDEQTHGGFVYKFDGTQYVKDHAVGK